MSDSRIFLLDIMPLVFRSYFATLGKNISTGEGIPTGATLGFYNYIFQIIFNESPDVLIAAQDSSPEKRLEIDASYKSNRSESPEDLEVAITYAFRLLDALKIPVISQTGMEADDVIGSLCTVYQNKGEVFIVSPDKDFAQLVNEKVYLLRPAYKGVEFNLLGIEGVKEKFGVPPEKIPDLLALMGDSVDNIPGIPGVGEKTAAKILAIADSVENIYSGGYIDTLKPGKLKDSLIQFKEQTYRSRRLAVIDTSLNIDLPEKQFSLQDVDQDALYELLEELEFRQLRERLEEKGILGGRKVLQPSPVEYVNSEDALGDTTVIGLQLIENEDERIFLTGVENRVLKLDEAHLKDILRHSEVIIVADAKLILRAVPDLSSQLDKFHDIGLAEYVLNPDKTIDLDHLRRKYKIASTENRIINAEQMLLHSFQIYETQIDALEELSLTPLFKGIEMPLTAVLAELEENGLLISEELLGDTGEELLKDIAALEKEIYQEAGYEFNINSTVQTGEVLQKFFGEGLKKTKTGKISSSEKILEELKEEHRIAELIIRYRKLNKLYSTYVASLPKYVSKDDGRIHACFSQTTAGTGRLSCSEPNLQNLPVKTEMGRIIRKAVVPAEGKILLAADYSQVELRLLAALSGDEALTEAFRDDKDIHAITAAAVFKIPEDAVTNDMRNMAKGVNFGIVYGITPFGLAERLRISQTEAKEFIENYFKSFPGVKRFQLETLEFARRYGFTKTLSGRIRFIDGINSRNGTNRKNAERVALNAPIQGLAADLIKKAMINCYNWIHENMVPAQMVLQVHDELVFELEKKDLTLVKNGVREAMETALDLSVPLKVDIGIGLNWLELDYD